MGVNSLTLATTAAQNVVIGQGAGYSITSGSYNVIIGDSAGTYTVSYTHLTLPTSDLV